jgi:hypothetical protein
VKQKIRIFAALACLLLTLARVAALEAPLAVRPTLGVVIESLLDPSVSPEQISSPSINFDLGAGLILPFSPGSRLSFEPSVDFYGAYYEYLNGRPVPTDMTFGSAFGLGLLLDAPVVYTLPLGGGFTLGMGAGLCLDIRAAITIDTDPVKAANTPAMNRYFWDKGRFATPSTLLRAEYALTDNVAFGLNGRVLWPIYNLWSGEGYGFFDRGMYFVELSIVYKLGKTGR